jgi:hypothetical protein
MQRTANDGHKKWARDFSAWASIHAFGPSTVNAAALRQHALDNNPIVRAAAEAVTKAEALVAKTRFAVAYTPTPAEHAAGLAAAKSYLRKVLKDARAEVAVAS